VELELVRLVIGPTIYHDFLKEHTEKIYHLGFDVKHMHPKLALSERMRIQIRGGRE